jgi:CubicO group peptidase (beta-lactamase class C family)
MLLNDGQLDGVRILSRKSVEMMHTEGLQGLPQVGSTLPAWAGFGLTFAVNPGPGKSGEPASEGSYWWGGAAGTSFWIDPNPRNICSEFSSSIYCRPITTPLSNSSA